MHSPHFIGYFTKMIGKLLLVISRYNRNLSIDLYIIMHVKKSFRLKNVNIQCQDKINDSWIKVAYWIKQFIFHKIPLAF